MLTREQALAVRERCLRALKARLIERANIIQVRTWQGAIPHMGLCYNSIASLCKGGSIFSSTPPPCLALHACITWLPPQTRLNEETAALERRHAALGRDRDAISAEEEEEAERGAEAASFRTAVLRTRLARHEEAAMARYRALDKRLRADPRLAALMAPA